MSFWTRPLALLYQAGAWCYHTPFDRGWRTPKRLPRRVVSVGNLSMGGTGKTPMVMALAREALKRGLRPAILTRGYGGTRRGVLLGGTSGASHATARDFGDEPVFLSRQLPDVPVLVGRDRFRQGSSYLAGGGEVDIFVMDDGFQHRGLFRDFNLLLLGQSPPLENARVIPQGPFRESVFGVKRAHAVAFLEGPPPGSAGVVPEDLPVLPARIDSLGFATLTGEPRPAPGSVWGVCGIANPERFEKTLKAEGCTLAGFSSYPDHHAYSAEEIHREEAQAREAGAQLVTTEKDVPRIEALASETWLVARIGVAFPAEASTLLDAILKGG